MEPGRLEVRRSFSLVLVVLLLVAMPVCAQNGDVLGMHDLSAGGPSPVQGAGSLGCTFCHAPHSGIAVSSPLWNQTLSTQSYTPYTSTTYHQTGQTKPTLGQPTSLCLSCHDGTIAIG